MSRETGEERRARSAAREPRSTPPYRSARFASAALLLPFVLLATGCTSHASRVEAARRDFYQGNFAQANERLIEAKAKRPREAEVMALDQAILELLRGRPDQAETILREVRDRFDHFEQRDLGESALTWVTDDTRRAYEGEDYEKVLIRAFLAISDLMDDGDDAGAYAYQINEKQQQIIDAAAEPDGTNPKGDYTQIALGAYLYGLLRETTGTDYDDAERAYERVVEWEPEFAAGPIDLERARSGVHSAPGHGVVHVIALVGRGPYKVEADEVPTSQAMFVADRILSIIGKHSVTPTIAPIKVPAIRTPINPLDRLQIACGGRAIGQTLTITDVGLLARRQYQATLPLVVGKAVARRAVKKAALYATKSAMGTQGLGELAIDLVGIAWEATENADTRCWGLLPEKIQVLRFEMPVGRHELAMEPRLGASRVGQLETHSIEVMEGRDTFVLVHYPDTRRLGEVLTRVH